MKLSDERIVDAAIKSNLAIWPGWVIPWNKPTRELSAFAAIIEREVMAAQQASEPVAWVHGCNVLTMDIELWLDRCPHCGKPRPEATPQQPAPCEKCAELEGNLKRSRSIHKELADQLDAAQKDAERLDWIIKNPQSFEDIYEEVWYEAGTGAGTAEMFPIVKARIDAARKEGVE